jgi:2,4-dienoyl-CoA reductase-like NADH-dependent reductase (Old Yellow Enzyme family)
VRLSYTDWADGGMGVDETVALARWLKEDGVDLIDVSSGGNTPRPAVKPSPGYQVPGAEAVRKGADMPVATVGLIDDAEQADAILRDGRADLVMLARAMLRDPYWPLRAAVKLGDSSRARLPVQYGAAWGHLGTFQFEPINAARVTDAGDQRVAGARRALLT